MTEEEIAQFLDAIKPDYTESLQRRLATIQKKLGELERKLRHLNARAYSQPATQATSADISNEKAEIRQKVDYLRACITSTHLLADKQGAIKRREELSSMQVLEFHDVHHHTELLTILDNRSYQLDKASRLVKEASISEGFTLSFGNIADLRASWEEAVDAVQLVTPKESPKERKARLEQWFDEEVRERGERGAHQRTANREGIARQTLSGIRNR